MFRLPGVIGFFRGLSKISTAISELFVEFVSFWLKFGTEGFARTALGFSSRVSVSASCAGFALRRRFYSCSSTQGV